MEKCVRLSIIAQPFIFLKSSSRFCLSPRRFRLSSLHKITSFNNYSLSSIFAKGISTMVEDIKGEKDQDFIYNGHHDLKSFLALKNINTNTPTYRGTLYEYQTITCLKTTLGIVTRRVGKANDGGIDFRGQWILPNRKRLYIIGQCKALTKKCPPNIIRELEGVLCQETEGTLCILSSMNGFTKSTIKRYTSSPFPIMLITVIDHGKKCGCISWNKAAEKFLKGFQITLKYENTSLNHKIFDILNSNPIILYNGKPFISDCHD